MTFDFMRFEVLDQQHKRPRYENCIHPFGNYSTTLPTTPTNLSTNCTTEQTLPSSIMNHSQTMNNEEMQISDERKDEDGDEDVDEDVDEDEDEDEDVHEDEDEDENDGLEDDLTTTINISENERILLAAEQGSVEKIKHLLHNNPFLDLNYRDVGVSASTLNKSNSQYLILYLNQ